MVLELLITVAAVFVVVFFFVLTVVTLLLSGLRHRRDRNRNAARDRVRQQLFERQSREEPEYEAWVAGLSKTERGQLEAILDRYLRNVSGSERNTYQQLAAELGMGEFADRQLDRRSIVLRSRMLARLSLLEYPITRKRLLDTCMDTRRTRQAAARLVAERPSAFEHPEITGTTLLLFDRKRALTAYGLETLYDLNNRWPMPILIRAQREADQWRPALLVQVCTVLEYCQAVVNPRLFEWVFPLFDHSDPTVRAAAIGVFRRHGWRDGMRSEIPFRQLITDEDSRVRRRTYEVLAYWGDQPARQLLEWAVIDEEDSRCQLTAVRALASLDADPSTNNQAWPQQSWEWVNAEIEADRTRLLPSEQQPRPLLDDGEVVA